MRDKQINSVIYRNQFLSLYRKIFIEPPKLLLHIKNVVFTIPVMTILNQKNLFESTLFTSVSRNMHFGKKNYVYITNMKKFANILIS